VTDRRRSMMSLTLSHRIFDRTWPCRPVRRRDTEELSHLLYASFHGTVDDEGETHADAVQEIGDTLDGGYGRLLWNASFVIEQGDVLASACLVSWYVPLDTPFVVFTMTRPEHKNQGMARSLMGRSIQALLDAGHSSLSLLVTDANAPAVHLYTSMGFQKVEDEPAA
jgi:GNAT superfamily N-acetyltransferase